MKPLTARERECLSWAAQGKTSWEIGRILGITERTVNFHVTNSCEKLEVRTRQAAITAALQWDLISVQQRVIASPARNPPQVHEQNCRGLQSRLPQANTAG